MALADTLKTDMGKPPVTAKPAVVKPDISSDLDVNKLLEMSKVPYGKELGQIAEDKKAAEQRAAMGQAQIKEKLPSYIAERRGEMEGEIKPLQQQLEFKPDQEYFKNTANIFMLVGMLGSFIGGKGSASAASNAQAALTGMMQGLVKGDDAEYARQKSIFDENSKFINQKINDIKDIYKQSMEMAVKDGIYEGKTNLAQELSSIGADVPAALAQVKSLQDIQKVVEHLSKTQAATDTAQKQIDAAMARTKFSAGAASQRELQREAFEMGQQERTLASKKEIAFGKKLEPIKGQASRLQQVLGKDAVDNLGTEEIKIVAPTVDSVRQTAELADLIRKNPQAAGVVGKTISFWDKYLPQRYGAQTETTAIPDTVLKEAEEKSGATDGLYGDDLSIARQIQKKVLDVINARTRAATGTGRFLIGEFNRQAQVLDISGMSPETAPDVYKSLASSDIDELQRFGISNDVINKVKRDFKLVPSSGSSAAYSTELEAQAAAKKAGHKKGDKIPVIINGQSGTLEVE